MPWRPGRPGGRADRSGSAGRWQGADGRYPTATAVAAAEIRPVAVNTSAVTPIRCSFRPTGPVPRSTATRHRPSNIGSSRRSSSAYHLAARDPALGQGRGPGSRRAHAVLTERSRGQAACRRSQLEARVSGRTRVSATEVMKLVSPTQRGTACRCRCCGMPAPAAFPEVGTEVDPLRVVRRLERSHPEAECRPQFGALVVGQLGQRPDMAEGDGHQVPARVGVGVEHEQRGGTDPEHPVVDRRRTARRDPAEDTVIGSAGVGRRGHVPVDLAARGATRTRHVRASPAGPQAVEGHAPAVGPDDSGRRRSAISRSSASVNSVTGTPRSGRSLPRRLTPTVPPATSSSPTTRM